MYPQKGEYLTTKYLSKKGFGGTMDNIGNENLKFSVLMPVYYKEKAEYFNMALNSILNQTLQPNEILIIEDGKIGDKLEQIIIQAKNKNNNLIRIIKLTENKGIGYVRTLGIKECKNEYIAFMDSDDISAPNRFELQIAYLQEHPDIVMIGSWITEFDGTPEKIYSKRILPTNPEDIYKFAKFRMPVNNNTIIFKKTPVQEVGSYQITTGFEDYEVCGKLLNKGYKIANIPEYLVNMRAGKEMMNRRKGLKYFFNYEYACMKLFYNIGFINFWEFLRNILLKFPLRIMPDWLRNLIYKKFLRSTV